MNEHLLIDQLSKDHRYKHLSGDEIRDMADTKIAWETFEKLSDIREVCYNAYLMSWGICFLLFLILLVLFF